MLFKNVPLVAGIAKALGHFWMSKELEEGENTKKRETESMPAAVLGESRCFGGGLKPHVPSPQ